MVKAAALPLMLFGTALAGGAGSQSDAPLSYRAALQGLPGLRIVEAPPFEGQLVLSAEQARVRDRYMKNHLGTYTLRVNDEYLFVSPGATVKGQQTSTTVNSISLVVDAPRPTLAQRRALTRVASAVLSACYPAGAALPGGAFWRKRVTRPWEKDVGWREKQFGPLKVSWSGQGVIEVIEGKRTKPMTAMFLEWPQSSGRCAL